MYKKNPNNTNVKKDIIQIIKNLLNQEDYLVNKIITSIPKEDYINSHLNQLVNNYTKDNLYINKERLLIAEIANQICKLNLNSDININCNLTNPMPRTTRIKIGILIYILESINNAYIIRNSKTNSKLYQLSYEALGDSFDSLNAETKLICLRALDNYLSDNSIKELIENNINNSSENNLLFSKPIYTDMIIDSMIKNLKKMIKKYNNANLMTSLSKITIANAAIGAFIAAAPGYGVGHTIGHGLCLIDFLNIPKSAITKTTLGGTSSFYKHYVADIIINSGTKRIFAKILEALAASIGALGAGTLSFIIYDISIRAIIDLYKFNINLDKKTSYNNLSKHDLLFISTLCELPAEAFSDKYKIENYQNINIQQI
ncbi:hypothetical protein N9L02_02025 [Gammaproteobacteria bacterium]|nr:hypothetical protein [Gammaproteobacteria bacterium]